ncbi:siderophore-interacting protein [Leucobacter denitrificans]|uniref:Siderophore-interacting protein n=1 Tax=Leucobacter denitrificans TaxID=683042 RepID=A0A7G9S740_9MICO|nr:siderophore-interacting protein [Leucobacter denitrificans]QNN63665.1 siderophore-interacting protein [Leucobacter denitrificans]
MSENTANELPPFQMVRAKVSHVERVSPSFARITFAGDELADFGTPGATFDQRIKLVFPPETGLLPDLSGAGADWYQAWLSVPEAERGTMRTYSIREVRAGAQGTEVVIDFVLHLAPGLSGPASCWAADAQVGQELLLIGPRRGRTDGGGIEFDPGDAARVLLAGDETAAPAIARILEDAPADLRGDVFIEVPEMSDELAIAAPQGVTVRWIARGEDKTTGGHGERLISAVTDHLGVAAELQIQDLDSEELLWETPKYSGLGDELEASDPHADRYFWIAGESGVVTTLRRHLVKTLGVDRAQVAFMGYWRHGVAMRG